MHTTPGAALRPCLLLALIAVAQARADEKAATPLRAIDKAPASYPGEAVPLRGDGLSFVYRTQIPIESSLLCLSMSPWQKDRTHIFINNGFDEVCIGNLNGLFHHLKYLGYRKVYWEAMWHPSRVAEKVEYVKKFDPEAKIVLLGYSAGSLDVRDTCNTLKKKGVFVDLLAYLGSDRVFDVSKSRPDNVGRILNVTGHGYFPTGGNLLFNGTEITGARNVRLTDLHMMLPSRRGFVDAFLQELAGVTAGVTPREPLLPPPAPAEVSAFEVKKRPAPTPAVSRTSAYHPPTDEPEERVPTFPAPPRD
jgi:hypothetical protein